MLIGIVGLPNSGKTILAVRYAKEDSEKGKKIFTNLDLFGIPYEKFDIEKYLEDSSYRDGIKNATILLDELTMYMDCRLNSKKSNLYLGYMVLQKRKRGLDFYYTVQDLDLIDYKRCVKYTDILVYAQEIYIKNAERKIELLDDYRNYTIIDMRKKNNNITQFNMKISPYYNYYDTDQIIEPIVDYKKRNKIESKTN